MVFVFGNRETGELDRRSDPFLVEERHRGETLANFDLAALDMVGSEKGVGSAARRNHGVARRVDHEMLIIVTGADAAHIADIVVERGEDHMPPIDGGYRALHSPAAQYVLHA